MDVEKQEWEVEDISVNICQAIAGKGDTRPPPPSLPPDPSEDPKENPEVSSRTVVADQPVKVEVANDEPPPRCGGKRARLKKGEKKTRDKGDR